MLLGKGDRDGKVGVRIGVGVDRLFSTKIFSCFKSDSSNLCIALPMYFRL